MNKSSLLIVDDKPENLLAMEMVVEDMDIDVVKVSSGQEALRICAKQDFALILLDVQMPEMDGFETAEMLRSIEKTRYIPIIFVTAIDMDQEHVFKGYESGAVDYLFKPVNKRILRGKVQVFIEMDQQRQQIAAHAIAMQNEIDERKQAQNEMQRLRDFLSEIINSMPSILVGVDKECNVTQWNKAAQEFTGMSLDEVDGKSFPEALPQFADQMERLQQSMDQRQPFKSERLTRQFAEITHYFDLMVYPLITGVGEGAVIRVDDVTDRVGFEEMLIHSEKMISVGGLAAGMAHEINNPLAAVLGGVQSIERRLTPTIEKNVNTANEYDVDLIKVQSYLENRSILRFLEMIKDGGERAARIVADMLSFSKPASSEKMPISLPNLLDRAVELVMNDYELKEKHDLQCIEILREYDEDVPNVVCEKSEISQVIFNLLKNSAYELENQENAKEEKIILRTKQEDDWAVIEIEDNGPGMDEDTSKRIFEPFFTTKPVGSGTGLGLAVSYFIITEKHQGTIAVESSVDQGCKFTIKLPLQK